MKKGQQALTRKRALLKSRLTKFQHFIDNFEREDDITQIKVRLTKAIDLFDEFDDVQTQLEELDVDEPDARDAFEDAYYTAIAAANIVIDAQTARSVNNDNNVDTSHINQNRSNIKLPTISLQEFNGKYDQWMPFHDNFVSLIHTNNDLSNVQKLHYLKSSLRGDASQIIQSLESTSQNYDIAWSLLQERYENKRLIIQSHVNALFNLSTITRESYTGLRQLSDGVNKQLRSLKSLGEPVEHWDTLLMHLVITKLDNNTRREWEADSVKNAAPKFIDLTEFLKCRCQILEALEASKQGTHKSTSGTNMKAKALSTAFLSTNEVSCFMCKQSHYLFQCDKLLKLTVPQRITEVHKLKLCLNCLRQNHSTSQCRSTNKCKMCSKKHNTLLHLETSQTNETEPSELPECSNTNQQLCSHLTTCNQVLLATAIVDIFDVNGKPHAARVLLDAGSQTNFITRDLAERLCLKTFNINAPIISINQTNTRVTQSTNATIRSRYSAYTSNLTFMILNQITSNLPLINVNVNSLKIPSSIQLADPTFNLTNPIDLLLGAEIFWSLLSVGQIKLAKNQPFLQKTQLGWIVSGRYISEPNTNVNTAVCNLVMNNKLEEQLAKFWTMEETPKRKYLTREEQICENKFVQTTRRADNGRFIVELPFHNDPSCLGTSKDIATRRFLTLERKLQRVPELKKQYSDFMDEYLSQGHMKILEADEENVWPHFYLPHHAVFKTSSTTTNLRVVFDGSCKSSNGVSLNNCLLVGPQCQEDLVNIVARFRTHKYVITADIAKMYRQINITPKHTHFQRILWRHEPNDTLKTFTLSTVTYGTASASFLAIRALQQTAHDHQEAYQEAAKIIKRDFYVDDLITGVNTIEEAIKLIPQISHVLNTGGFELRKWNSNERSILAMHSSVKDPNFTLELDKELHDKILGLTWTCTNDQLKYAVVEQEVSRVTKRVILSRIARIFDPLGLIGPVIVTAKLILQKLWQIKSDWDESVPEQLYSEWITYSSKLQSLDNLTVPRRITQDHIITTVIHGFCDASESANGACLYMWTLSTSGTVKTILICAKSRVAPLKQISLPKLELCGAQLLVQTYQKIVPSLNIKIDKSYYWTDSQIVLAWISSEAKIWKTFVANRVGEIQECSQINEWGHVKSEDNPADLLSKGIDPSQIADCQLWWNGIFWLNQEEEDWPVSLCDQEQDNETWEERKTISLFSSLEQHSNDFLTKYSSFTKLQRVTAYCFRFINNLRHTKTERQGGPLNPAEITTATNFIIKEIQSEAFLKDIMHLRKFKQVHKKCALLALNPFLDEHGMLRVGGRLENSKLDYNSKHPLLIPPKHHVTKLLVAHYHGKLLHAGAAETLANIRQKYWPLSGMTTVKSEIRKCVKCFRTEPRNIQHLMGQLPQSRVDPPKRPFIETGIDYCGPLLIHEGNRRSRKIIKAYIAIFVCFATKATHLEIVLDLSTESFLNTLKRFMSRRGKPNKLHSDNATNFVGAERQLAEFLQSEEFTTAVIQPIQQEEICWEFIPPRSPHFGGLWEATVKSFKRHLKRTVGNASLTYEELLTIVAQIEACLNSRPLTPISNDSNDLTVLTPAHFLIGDLLTTPMEQDVKHINENRLTRWQRVQQINQHFWSRWSSEYVTHLQKRTKWKTDSLCSIKEGSMVIIKDDQQPPLRWVIGRVVSIHPGRDGIIRAASIKTATGTFIRASAKLCPLPFEG